MIMNIIRIATSLITVLILFLIFVLGTWFFITKWEHELIRKKELFATLRELLTVIAIIGGGFLTYFRFFKGRIFSEKADVEITVQLIETPNDSILHSVNCFLINKGSTTIWNPTTRIGIKRFYINNTITQEVVDGIREKSFFDEREFDRYFVDPGEKIIFLNQQEHDYNVWAVLYEIEISSKSKATWKTATLVNNQITKVSKNPSPM